MALERYDRIVETTTTTGTGTYDLAGAKAGFQAFVDRVTTGATVEYCCTDGTDFEIGIGTFTDAAPDTLARTTILASTNGDAAVNWGAGSKDIFLSLPASRMVPGDSGEAAYHNADGVLDGFTHLTFSTTTQNVLLQTSGTGIIGQVIKATAGQTANLQEWQDSSGTVKAEIQADGKLVIDRTEISSGVIEGNLINLVFKANGVTQFTVGTTGTVFSNPIIFGGSVVILNRAVLDGDVGGTIGNTDSAVMVKVSSALAAKFKTDNLHLGKGITHSSPANYTINATGGSGTDIAGGDLIITGGKGTGNAQSGDIVFQTSAAGSSGSTLQTLVDTVKIQRDTLSLHSVVEGGTANVARKSVHETHTLANAATSDTTTISIPSGARLVGVSMNVNTAVVDDAGDDTWSAAFITGSTTTIVTGAAAAQNTKVDFIVPDEKTTATTQIRFTAQGGNFTAGVIEVVAYYEELTSLANAA